MIKNDSLADSFSTAICACLPFITVGMLGNRTILIISTAIATLALLGLISRVIFKWPAENKATEALQRIITGIVGFPLPFALCAAILQLFGHDLGFAYAFAGIMALLVICSQLLPLIKESKQQ